MTEEDLFKMREDALARTDELAQLLATEIGQPSPRTMRFLGPAPAGAACPVIRPGPRTAYVRPSGYPAGPRAAKLVTWV
jgi:hypothetical protein